MKKIPFLFKIPYPVLKWSALLFMTYDHVLTFILHADGNSLAAIPGRFAFPLFMFMIATNLANRDIAAKYIKRLIPFAIISSMVDYCYYSELNPQNILWTFVVAISLVWLSEKITNMKDRNNRYISYIYTFIIMSIVANFVDYGILGVWAFFFVYRFIKHRNLAYYIISLGLLSLVASNPIEWLVVIMFCASLFLVEIKPSASRPSFRKTGWLFYAYFPFHKWIIALIS